MSTSVPSTQTETLIRRCRGVAVTLAIILAVALSALVAPHAFASESNPVTLQL
ncbi:hypothetical protein [Cryobacterium roopkundense]|uniref:Uncharacterized protein n=1 Tax=Cryobacterium roopkundense TaxID=1001240 RepID=A0A7W9E573_9MICO|nr:hypothetical protein [Cryobacterium roopkundense]MBB5642174.1 hypothetical protein [Cryobacterium roopkundense]